MICDLSSDKAGAPACVTVTVRVISLQETVIVADLGDGEVFSEQEITIVEFPVPEAGSKVSQPALDVTDQSVVEVTFTFT